eukprot:5479456-Amphidinium_carterae.2
MKQHDRLVDSNVPLPGLGSIPPRFEKEDDEATVAPSPKNKHDVSELAPTSEESFTGGPLSANNYSQGDTPMTAGDVGADGDRTGPYSLSDRPGRELNAQSSQSESALVPVRSVPSGRIKEYIEEQRPLMTLLSKGLERKASLKI